MKSSNQPTELDSLLSLPTYTAGVAQSTAYRLLKKFTEEYISHHGITMMQWFIIGTIYEAGSVGIGVTQLSKAVDTNVPYITNTLNLLEHKGMIERSTRDQDSRAKIVTIAAEFVPTIVAIEKGLRQRMRTVIYADITSQELRTYLVVLYKFIRALETS